jgi:peptidoglycan hydrolase-like protein with peptidoglycan-binding domain
MRTQPRRLARFSRVAGARARRLSACAAAAGALALAGCDGGDDETTTAAETATTSSTTTEAEATTTAADGPPDGGGGGAAKPQLYFTAGEQFRKVDAELPAGGDEVTAAAKALVAGPEGGRVLTQIPEGTAVERVSVAADGTAAVEVSPEFLDGIPARASERSDVERQELAARLGQLTYTLTQFEGVEAVDVVAGGEAVERDSERADFAAPEQGPRRKQRAKGEKSSSTRRLQLRLAELQYLPRSAVDGVAGYRTQQAVIAFQSWEGLARDGIVGPQTRAALKRAKPPKPRPGGPGRRLEVYREKGVVLLIAGGRVKRAIHVSTGAPGTPTPAGTFEVFRKELKSWSVPFQVWLPYASYFTGGIAFHEYADVPVFPASHGCVRVPAPEAQIVYRFAKLGTTVVVV